jgi:AbrB family looped-hinge helix DNA binding protein
MKATYPLTSKSQITVPKEIRKHLQLKPGDRAIFSIKKDGEVVIKRPPTPAEIMARVGKPTGAQPLTEREKLIGGYLAKKYNVKI